MLRSVIKEFKEFALRGNVVDLAIGVIIGTSFAKVVASLVTDIIMPPIGLLLGQIDFSSLYLNISGRPYPTLSEAEAAGIPIIRYGLFLNSVIGFLIVAAVIFGVVKVINRFRAAAAPSTRECPFCISNVSLRAVKCSSCGSALPAVVESKKKRK